MSRETVVIRSNKNAQSHASLLTLETEKKANPATQKGNITLFWFEKDTKRAEKEKTSKKYDQESVVKLSLMKKLPRRETLQFTVRRWGLGGGGMKVIKRRAK